MRSASRLAFLLFVVAVALVLSRTARAQPAKGVTQILALDVEEGSEEQADGLGVALRARIKSSSPTPVAETSTSVGMIGAALKCSSHPDANCLQRIGDHLKVDHFYWGSVNKAGKGQVAAELHSWTRGKGDSSSRETYPDTLKDPTSEELQRVAARLYDKINGTSIAPTVGSGTLHVQTQGVNGGDVFANDVKRGELKRGELVVPLPAGTYTVEVRAAGYQPSKKQVTVNGGQEALVSLPMTRELANVEAAPVAKKEEHGSSHKVLGWGLVGLGVVASAVAVVEVVHWSGLQSKVDDARGADGNFGVPRTADQPRVDDPCNFGTPNAKTACDANKDAKTSSIVAWVAGGVGLASLGVGVYFLVTDKGSSSADAPPPTNASLKPRLSPYAGPKAGGLALDWTF